MLLLQGVALLAGPFHEGHPGFRPKIASALLGYTMLTPASRKLGAAVLQAAGSTSHPLLTGTPAAGMPAASASAAAMACSWNCL